MKRALSLILALVMSLSLCACGQKIDPEEKFREKVQNDVLRQSFYAYGAISFAKTTLTTIQVEGDTYTGKGTVSVRDNNGDTYVGSVTAVYRYDKKTDSFTKINLELGSLRAQ